MTEFGGDFVRAGKEFIGFARSYRHAAFRLEVRDNYAASEEAEHLARFLADEPADDSWMEDWMGMILRRTLDGQQVARVRVVSHPWSDYTRFGLHLSRLNVASGEDIRYMPRDCAAKLGLPNYDFWLLDGHRMCILHHDDEDVLLGADVVTDPAIIVQHCHYREIARHYAIPRAEYISRYDDYGT